MGRMILSKRFWPAILLLWLPLVLLLAVLVLRDLLPLPQGAHRYDVYVAGDFAINSYRTPKGQYYDLTMTREGRTVVLVDRVYAYGKETGLLYVRGVTGAAAIDPRTGACTLYTEEYFPKYGRLAPGVQLNYSLNFLSQEDRAQLNQLTERYAAYPAADALATLGCGRFRIQQVTGKRRIPPPAAHRRLGPRAGPGLHRAAAAGCAELPAAGRRALCPLPGRVRLPAGHR